MTSVERGSSTRRSLGEGLSGTEKETTTQVPGEERCSPYNHYHYKVPSDENLDLMLDAVQRGGDLFFFASISWSTGNTLSSVHEYEQAAKCFERMLQATIEVKEPFLIELSRVARDLCDALVGEHGEEKVLLQARERLNQSLFQVDEEDVSFVQDALRANLKALAPARKPTGVPSVDSPASPPTHPSSRRNQETPVDPNTIGLRVRLFGRFEVRHRGKSIRLEHNNKALAIFKYLLSRKSRSVSQDHLIEWLWPNSGLRKARWSLNSAIYSLRCTLGQELSSAASSDYISLKSGYYHLAPEIEASSDVEEFDARYERGRMLEISRQVPQAIAEYEKALELYRNDYLIENLYEDWTMIERERLANSYLEMLQRISHYYAEEGQLQKSVQVCYQLLGNDPLHEESYRLLMHCYVRLGLRTRALHQYQLCEQILERQLGMEPSPETQDLYRTLLRGENI